MPSSYLERYTATTRQKVDMALADRFDYLMRREGDKPIRQRMAQARRAATSMETLLQDFKDLPIDQLTQLQGSAKVLRKLAEGMEGLARFAKGYKVFYDAEVKREHEERLDAFASKRWGTDDAAMLFEWDLLKELERQEGQSELGRWMHGRNRFTEVGIGNFLPPFHGFPMEGKDKRSEAAWRLWNDLGQHTKLGFNDTHCHVGMQEYERYLEERKAAASLAKTILNSAKAGSPKE